MAERVYIDVGAEHFQNKQNWWENPQESYSVVVRAIQSEWLFLQYATQDTGEKFAGVEKMIQETFLPPIFLKNTKSLSPIVGSLSTMPVKK